MDCVRICANHLRYAELSVLIAPWEAARLSVGRPATDSCEILMDFQLNPDARRSSPQRASLCNRAPYGKYFENNMYRPVSRTSIARRI